MSEIDSIRQRYERRSDPKVAAKYPDFSPFQHFARCEREFWYGRYLARNFTSFRDLRVLEIGAGGGSNLAFFKQIGCAAPHIFANELLPERLVKLRDWLPEKQIFPGDALQISPPPCDVVFQSTVFSSILDKEFRLKLARKMWEWLRPGGMILWYDFIYNNPGNADVVGIPWAEVKALFPEALLSERKLVTLAPPIGRRVGRLYNFVNIPPLRTHIVAVLTKL